MKGARFRGWKALGPGWAVLLAVLVWSSGTLRAQAFLRGDANSDGRVSVSDSHFLLSFLFRGGRPLDCASAGDVNSDGVVDLGDPIFLLAFLVLGGPAPCPPFPTPGEAPPGSLSCRAYSVGPTLEDAAAEMRILNAIVGADARTTLHLLVSSSMDIAGYSATIAIGGSRFGRVETVTDLSETLTTGFAAATVFRGKIRVGFIGSLLGTERIEAGEGRPVMQLRVCIEGSLPAGDYDMRVESAELVDFETGEAIIPAGKGDVLAVPVNLGDGGCVSPEEPDPKEAPCPPGTIDPGPRLDFARGDVNLDGRVSVSDALRIRRFLFNGGLRPPCMDAADVNDDGRIDRSDIVFLAAHLHRGEPPPPAPFPGTGADPTGDDLGCAENGITAPGPVGEDVLSLGIIEARPGDRVSVPVLLASASEIEAFQLAVRCDPHLFLPREGTDGLSLRGSFFGERRRLRPFHGVRMLADPGDVFTVGFIPHLVQEGFEVPPGESRHVFSINGRVSPEARPGSEIELTLTDGPGGEGWGPTPLRNELSSRGTTRLPRLVSGAIRVIEGVAILRGDANHDSVVNITDAIYLLGYLFLGGAAPPCPDEADANDDGVLNIGDAIAILDALFLGPSPIRPPFPDPGLDPTADDLGGCGSR